jgi:hypothetical protein
MDGDCLFLCSDWPQKISEALSNNGHEFGLIGCYTNRLRSAHQLHEGKFSDNHDIRHHWEIAKSYHTPIIRDLKGLGVAGVFMAFQKETWMLAGGFQENSITSDSNFNLKIRKLGLKIGIMENMYIYHAYRPWADSGQRPWDDIKHLR